MRGDISILVMGDDSDDSDNRDDMGYDRRRAELSNAPLNMKQDTINIEN